MTIWVDAHLSPAIATWIGKETRFESLGNITTTNIRPLWLNAPILQSLRELKTLMPESHFHAVDVRYLREFVNSP